MMQTGPVATVTDVGLAILPASQSIIDLTVANNNTSRNPPFHLVRSRLIWLRPFRFSSWLSTPVLSQCRREGNAARDPRSYRSRSTGTSDLGIAARIVQILVPCQEGILFAIERIR